MKQKIDIDIQYKMYLQTGIVLSIQFNRLSDILQVRNWQKLCRKKYNKIYRQNNLNRIKVNASINGKIRYQKNIDNVSVVNKQYYRANKHKIIRNSIEYTKKRTKIDPIYRFSRNLRNCIYTSFRRNKNEIIKKQQRTENIIGCSIKQFLLHISSKLSEGMTMQNHGTVWHLDHIIPIAAAKIDCPNEDQLKKRIVMLNHYTNFQPMLIGENLKKHDKIPEGTSLPWDSQKYFKQQE